MDRRKDHLSQRMAHSSDLPYQLSRNTGIPVKARRNETNGLYRAENSSESRIDLTNVPLKVAKLIYESEFWASTNFEWLFSELVPEWYETDPADWPVVRRILQEFIHRDFVRQFPRAKEEVEPRQAELKINDSESSESHDSLVVRIVRDSTRPSLNSSSAINSNQGYTDKLLPNIAKEVKCGRKINSESMIASYSKSARAGRTNTKRYHAEKVIAIRGPLDSSSESHKATGKMQNKKRVKCGSDRVRRSISLQSLDDLLDEVLEEEEALEKRRRKKTSAKSGPDNKLCKSCEGAEVPDKVVVPEHQPTPTSPSLNGAASKKEEFGGSTQNKTSPTKDDILQILDELDADLKPKHKSKKQTRELIKDDLKKQPLKECCRVDSNKLEHNERPKSRRGCAEPRSPLDINYKSPSPGSMDSNKPDKFSAIPNHSSGSMGSVESFLSYFSTENFAALHQLQVHQIDSNAAHTIVVDANYERVNSKINICDTANSQRCESVEVSTRPRHRKRFLNLIRKNLLYCRRKLKSINCCSNSID